MNGHIITDNSYRYFQHNELKNSNSKLFIFYGNVDKKVQITFDFTPKFTWLVYSGYSNNTGNPFTINSNVCPYACWDYLSLNYRTKVGFAVDGSYPIYMKKDEEFLSIFGILKEFRANIMKAVNYIFIYVFLIINKIIILNMRIFI